MHEPPFSIGVEEEFQIVDASTRELKSHARRVVPLAQADVGEAATNELFLSQVETGTPICHTLADVEAQVKRLRLAVVQAAEQSGTAIVAASTHPFSLTSDQDVTPKQRYLDMVQSYGLLLDEHLICGCHVHVGIGDREAGIAIMNRARGFNAVLLALSGNSPFWEGADTLYSSFRTEVWRRWPMAGAPLPFRNRAEYDDLVQDLVRSGAIADETRIYWDIRPADRFETIEFRACDIGTGWRDTTAIAILCRALAHTCWREYAEDQAHGREFVSLRSEILRAAEWRAARYGVEDHLIDVRRCESRPASEVVDSFLNWLRPVLEDRGEWTFVSGWAQQVLAEGNGATKQRRALEESGSLSGVVDDLVARTKDEL